MIDMMEERRKWKSIHSEEGGKKYKSLNNRLRWITDKARENGGMNSVQNWTNMRHKERWIFYTGRFQG